jgi:hypothetical protein
MKFNNTYFLIGLCLVVIGCAKTNGLKGSASLNIVNAVNGSNPLVTNFTPLNGKGQIESALQYYETANQIVYAGSWESGSYTGLTSLTLSQIDDTTTSIWSGTFNLVIGSMHTLFLIGDTASVDTLFTTDIIAYFSPADSVTGVRFVNLAQYSTPVLVTIQADTTHTPITSNMAYKTMTTFQQLSANSNAQANGYTFEFRDAASDSVLTTYSYAIVPFKSVTICLIGQEGVNVVSPLSSMLYDNF